MIVFFICVGFAGLFVRAAWQLFDREKFSWGMLCLFAAFSLVMSGQPWFQGFLQSGFLLTLRGYGNTLNQLQLAVQDQGNALETVQAEVRAIFARRKTEVFNPTQRERAIVDQQPIAYRETNGGRAQGNFVYLVLSEIPITQTLQVRYGGYFEFTPGRITVDRNVVCVLLIRAENTFAKAEDELVVTYDPDPEGTARHQNVEVRERQVRIDNRDYPRGLGLLEKAPILSLDASQTEDGE